MARHRDDPSYVPASDEERRLRRHLASAFAFTRADSDQGARITFSNGRAMQDFFDCVVRMGDRGFALGAALFADRVRESDPGREVRSMLLTKFARALYELEVESERRPIRESEVAIAGRFVNAIIAEMPEVHVEWAEDMGDGCPVCGLDPQPTAVIRGVLLSPSLDHRNAARFWRLSSESKRFPFRIFSDPCRSEDGTIFAPWHLRAFALVFTHAPKEAVERFAAHMREHATVKMLKVRIVAEFGPDKWVDQACAATDVDRKNVFSSIAGSIEAAVRRTFVGGLFGLEC